MQYRRSQAKGAAFFFTVVTYKRKRILCHEANVALIKEAFQQVIKQHTLRIRALSYFLIISIVFGHYQKMIMISQCGGD